MNLFRRFAVFARSRGLEVLLAVAVLLLIVQLAWPAIIHWWRLPSPGRIGFDTFRTATLADEFVVQLPTGYRNGQHWPVVVFLHGSGERGRDASVLREQGPFRQKLPAIVVAPQCLPSNLWEPDAVAAFIEYIAPRYHADPQRIYLVGYSMGGYGAWQTCAVHSQMFAAIVPISGGGNSDWAKLLASIPIWVFHGMEDKIVPVSESERIVEAIRNAGGQPKLTIIPNAGHGICGTVCTRNDLWEWLFQQHRGK